MITIIDNSTKQGSAHIQILYPGIALNLKDTGFSTIGRIDQANANDTFKSLNRKRYETKF